jgi:hypothetical protein
MYQLILKDVGALFYSEYEYAAQCKLVFSSCKQRYPKLNAEILTYHNSQLLIILLTNKCAEV